MTADLLAPAHVQQPRRASPIAAAQRYALVALMAVVLAGLHLRHRPVTLCPFRALTGIPCPFCGGTTAAVELGHGDLRGALAASPIAVGLLASWPLLGMFTPPRWWQSRRTRRVIIVAVLVFAEIWQLVRFGILHG